MKHYNIGDYVEWKGKRGPAKGIIIDTVSDSPATIIGNAGYIIQQDNGYRLLLLQSELK